MSADKDTLWKKGDDSAMTIPPWLGCALPCVSIPGLSGPSTTKTASRLSLGLPPEILLPFPSVWLYWLPIVPVEVAGLNVEEAPSLFRSGKMPLLR